MPLTRYQKKRSAASSSSQKRGDDAPDLFEPRSRTTTHRHGTLTARPGRTAPSKRPASRITSSSASAKKKQRNLLARLDATVRPAPLAAAAERTTTNDTDTSAGSSDEEEEVDENSTTANDSSIGTGVATVTPAAPRVRLDYSLSIAAAGIRSRLPDDVVDIFDTTTTDGEDDALAALSSVWETSDESMRNYVTDFLRTYGPEYYRQIYEQEEQEFQEDDDTNDGPVWSLEQFHMTDPPTELEQSLPCQPLLTVKMRHVLIAWLAEVTAEFKLSQCAYHLAVSLLNELLRRGPTLQQYKEEQDMIRSGLVSDDEDDDVEEHFLIKPRNFQAVGWYVGRSLFDTETEESRSRTLFSPRLYQRLHLDRVED
jgi:Cyclin, N-terminal domain